MSKSDIGSLVLGAAAGTAAFFGGLSAPLIIGSSVIGTYAGSKIFKYESIQPPYK